MARVCLEQAEKFGDNQHVRLMKMHLDQKAGKFTTEGLAGDVEALLDTYPEDEAIVERAGIYAHMLGPKYQAELLRRKERKTRELT